MDNACFEETMKQELGQICLHSSDTEDLDSSSEDECISDEDPIPDEIPESVLSCLKSSTNRIHHAKQLILQDLEETYCDDFNQDSYGVISDYSNDLLKELASDYHEDPIRLKERILCEIEEEEALNTLSRADLQQASQDEVKENIPGKEKENLEDALATEYVETETRCHRELELLEKKLKEIEENRTVKLMEKKIQQQKEQREEEERKKQRKFEEDLEKLEDKNMKRQAELEAKAQEEYEKTQQELRTQEELIEHLQKHMDEQKRAFERQQAMERKRTEDIQCRAAIRIQATVRRFLVLKKTAFVLSQKREERKRKRELQLQLQKEQREREERLRKKIEEQKLREEEEKKQKDVAERLAREEQERRQAAYRKAKEEDRLRLERERKLKLEEARKRKEEEMKQREECERRLRMEEEERQAREAEKKKREEQRRAEEMERKRLDELRKKSENEEMQKQKEDLLKEKQMKCEHSSAAIRLDEISTISRQKCTHSTTLVQVSSCLGSDTRVVEQTNKEQSDLHVETSLKITNALVSCNTESSPPFTDKTEMDSVTSIKGQSLQENGSFCCTDEAVLGSPCQPGPYGKSEVNYESVTVSDTTSPSHQMCLPDGTEQKRLAWMKACTPWSQISMQHKRMQVVKRKVIRKSSAVQLPALSTKTILQSGDWISLKQVTRVTLQDLPGCSLSTLSECTKLQMLSLRRCGLTALDGLSGCKDLKYIDVQENTIQFLNCQDLDNIEILLLNQNQLTSVHGLEAASNVQVLELSHNHITRISGLESLKKLQTLIIDHNQLISTKGLKETSTLLYLDCAYNHLNNIDGLDNCALLTTLKLQGNNLTEPPSLVNHVLMKELYMDDNNIVSLESLSACWLPLLRMLSVSRNSLTHLGPLSDFVSLLKFDISHNCLSELSDIQSCLEGCLSLKEINLIGNPFEQETNWRSSVRGILPGLKKINEEFINSTQVSPSDRSTRPPPGSFLALCQDQLKQLERLLKRHDSERRSVLCPLDVPVTISRQSDELKALADEHRYAHEYGDMSISDGDEPGAQDNLLMQGASDRHQHNIPFISQAKENNQDPEEFSKRWIIPSQVQLAVNWYTAVQDQGNQEAEILGVNAGSSAFTSEESKENEPRDKKGKSYTATPQQKHAAQLSAMLHGRHLHQHQSKDLKNMAVVRIQSYWRGYLCRRNQWRSAQHIAAMVIQSAWRKYCICKNNRLNQCSLQNSKKTCMDTEKAATVIQATWKGYVLRKKLHSALAAVKVNEMDDDFEEMNMDEVAFDEAAMEKYWRTLDSNSFSSKTLPVSEQLHWPKPPNYQASTESQPGLLWKPKEAWSSEVNEETPTREQYSSSQTSECSSSRAQSAASRAKPIPPSRKKEQILEEWGLRDSYTAQLMIKRAQKMKSKSQQNQRKLDPAVRLALFKKNENKHAPVKPQKKIFPEKTDYFKAREEEFASSDTRLDTQIERSKELTYQWLHTQAVHADISSPGIRSDRFLPEIDPDVLNGRRVQLMASPVSRERLDQEAGSVTSGSALTEGRKEYNQPRRISTGHAKREVPVPVKAKSAPSTKERISYRDNPAQLSTGWGGGKKRSCK
ncbi:leucine-rich repeat and IQ domain-containing protein 1 [Amia ocellicauda]|uniref:leucine-rich repeat and IQ domain-containing protein 1 n=1 Tax=Amia ocellicauda TaxID=2972642 RepID=UPI003464E2EC